MTKLTLYQKSAKTISTLLLRNYAYLLLLIDLDLKQSYSLHISNSEIYLNKQPRSQINRFICVLTYIHIKHLFKIIPAEILISELHTIRNVSSTIKAWQKLYLKYVMHVTAFAQVI